MDGQTHMAKLIAAFYNFVNVTENCLYTSNTSPYTNKTNGTSDTHNKKKVK